jgi:murein DD-endopeptidase MepM/ murein hydrolase activator NlpD
MSYRYQAGMALSAVFGLLLLAFPGATAVSFAPSASGYVYPVMAPRLSSNYGMRIHPIRRFSQQHTGIDLAAPIGSPIRAIAAGTVVFADPYAGFGNLVVIKHNSRLTSHYAHCDKIKIRPGQRVKAGQIISYVGSSGLSTGPHLHFEIRVDGEPRNPESYIPGLAEEAKG